MDRTLFISATAFLLVAFVLSLFISLSLPYFPALGITRVHFANSSGVTGRDTLSELRLGIWGTCTYANDGANACVQKKLAYEVMILNPRADRNNLGIVKSSWTRGLVVHAIATGFSFLTILTSFTEKPTVNSAAFVLSCLAALFTFIAFIIDIALFALVRSLAREINVGASTRTAPGFWLTFVSLVLVILATMILYIGRRRERRSRGLQLLHTNIERPENLGEIKGRSYHQFLSTPTQSKGGCWTSPEVVFFSQFARAITDPPTTSA